MKIIHSLPEMQQLAEQWRLQGKRIGFVPTMGYLHEGHLALVKISKSKTDFTVVSIFVNPTQFGPTEDFEKYPRDEKGDLAKLQQEKVDVVFLPTAADMYPENFQTHIHLSRVSQGLCGKSRPGHFDGVATVVLKLFNLVKPHLAVFGEKDYQQFVLIQQMVKDLNLDIEIAGCPTLRSPEGLALSSRNVYLNAPEKKKALCLSQAITHVQTLYQQGQKEVFKLLKEAEKNILQYPEIQIEYLEIVDAQTLEPLQKIDRPARFLLAMRIGKGKTRLIDNGPL